MIEIKDLKKSYLINGNKTEALKGINLKIEKGQVFGIIGKSGAGKSTLLRCLNLLETPDEGEIIVEGRDITKFNKRELREYRKNVSMIFQHFNLLSNSNVYKNVAFPLEIAGHKRDYIDKRVRELLKIVGIEDKEKEYPSNLSGGQKQRVAIARALANNPKILLCDEATSALDPLTTKQILDLLLELNKTLGLTIVLITHEMDVVDRICSNVAVMEKGEIVEEGIKDEVFKSPKSKTLRQFLQSQKGEVIYLDFKERAI
ncbi:methionine ABC transporter ATP-binding protein [Caloramator proteoclasticus]|uniref:D-methionine transport system ATP-binding protein n=1 Tax=Caloramator proteoclasticus DSM 10124 TaxID=1121262 RepID=A0A1M4ZKA7_9CLOT|nr:ATP-binding cassette domain-containing protein [Caloramator proteoclasticus]SHF18247.1 D-methionine transport system ATP-binding protein [Caloramator proteoclasticus DSM 10124]